METLRPFLVILLAVGLTQGQVSKPAKPTFPDLLAPFRGIFKSRQQQQQQPHNIHSSGQPMKHPFHASKDAGQSDIKYPGQVSDDESFRPYFPNEYESSGGESTTSSRPPSVTPFDPYYRMRPAASNRIPRQESEVNPQGFEYQPYPAQGQGSGSEDQPENMGFTDFGFSSPDFGSGYGQPQSQQQVRSHSRPQPHRRPFTGDFGGPVPQGSEQTQGHGFHPQGPPPHHRRPFRGQPPNHEFHSSPQHRPYHSSTPANFPGNYEQQQDSRREPQIITLDDLQKENAIPTGGKPGYFDDMYRQGPAPGPSSAHVRHGPAFTEMPNPSNDGSGIYEGQSQRHPIRQPHHGGPRHRPYNPYSGGSDEIFQETKPRNQFALRPRRPQSYSVAPGPSTLKPDLHYGKPMLMMSSSTPPAAVMAPKRIRPFRKLSDKPILLSSPKIPNYMKSASISNPVVQVYEPQTAESGSGGFGGGGDFGGISSNGDRILYHVAGHQGPYSYRFGYDTGKGYNRLFRFEEKDGQGHVKGRYGFYDKHGKMNVVNYEAHPQHGFSAHRGH